MESPSHIAHLGEDSTRISAALRADPAASVPSCPGWDVAKLVRHVAGTQAWVSAQLAAGPAEPVDMATLERPPKGDELADWYDDRVATLVERLGTMDLEARWPTFAGRQPGSFFPRRMAHETAVHRWDAEGAVGAPAPIDDALAADGIDEVLALFVGHIPGEALGGATGTLVLRADEIDGSDGPGQGWTIVLGADGITSQAGSGEADVTVRGDAGDLLLLLWNRVPADRRFTVTGDPGLLDVWRTAVVL